MAVYLTTAAKLNQQPNEESARSVRARDPQGFVDCVGNAPKSNHRITRGPSPARVDLDF